MLLSDRYQGLIHFCLIGMEVSWITPFVALLLHQQGWEWSATVVFARLLVVLLGWVLVLELLNKLGVDSPAYELVVSALVVVCSLLLVRSWLYAGAALGDFGWLRNVFDALFNIHLGLRSELVLILASLLLWQRAASGTSRSLDFFDVGVSFRLGILLLVLGAGLLNYVTGEAVAALLWIYLALGLTAVAVSRIRDKAASARSAGRTLPLRRLIQLLATVGLTVGGVAWLSLFYTSAGLKTALGWLRPLWTVLGFLMRPLMYVLFWVVQIVLGFMDWVMRRVLAGMDLTILKDLVENLSSLAVLLQQRGEGGLTLPPWLLTGLRYAGVLLGILLAVGFVLLSLRKIRSRGRRQELEEASGEEVTFGGGTLGRGWRWLRDRAGLVRRFGLGRQLLAAISVQNIYANLCRLGSRRGYPRHPSQPPDDYLPVLVEAFQGHEEPLGRITAAYMRVHYGEHPVSRAELAELRRDYSQVRTAERELDG